MQNEWGWVAFGNAHGKAYGIVFRNDNGEAYGKDFEMLIAKPMEMPLTKPINISCSHFLQKICVIFASSPAAAYFILYPQISCISSWGGQRPCALNLRVSSKYLQLFEMKYILCQDHAYMFGSICKVFDKYIHMNLCQKVFPSYILAKYFFQMYIFFEFQIWAQNYILGEIVLPNMYIYFC